MAATPGAPNRFPVGKFGFRYNLGESGNKSIRQNELKKARRKRIKETAKTPHRQKKKKLRREIFQSHITENRISLNDSEAYGDGLQKKKTQTTRAAFQNAHCFPEHISHYKSRNILSHIVEGEYNVWLTCEVGLCWRKLIAADQWEERKFGKF